MPDHWTPEEQRRLQPRNQAVLDAMNGEGWVTLEQVASRVGMRNASTVASRLRDLKATGRWSYARRATGTPGIHEYRLFEAVGNPLQLELSEVVNA